MRALWIAILASSVLVVGAKSVVLASDLDPSEGLVMRYLASMKLKVILGPVEPLMTQGELGIQGGAPDGHVSTNSYGGVTRAFFQCWDGQVERSCLSETSSVDTFSSLAGLFRDPTGTHFQPVMDGPVANDPYESQYAALYSTWRDPATGVIHGWYHAEVPVPGCTQGFYASIGYATSNDDGHVFTKQGIVVTNGQPVVPDLCVGQGAAQPYVIEAGDYLYMLYDSWIPPDYPGGGIAIARASKATPGYWTKYDQGSFSQSGLGGARTILIPLGSGGQQSWGAAVIWNSNLGKFLMVHSDFNHEGTVYLRASRDLVNWTSSQVLFDPSPDHSYRYPTLVGATDGRMGYAAWLYFGRQATSASIGPDTLLARRSVILGGF
jgi:hypothetical protein